MQYNDLRDYLLNHMIDVCVSDITVWEFKRVYGGAQKNRPNATHQTKFQELQVRKRMQKGGQKGKTREVMQPVIACAVKLEEIVPFQKRGEDAIVQRP